MESLTISEVSKMLRRTLRTMLNYIVQGKLKAFKVNRYWLIPKEAVIAFLEESNGISVKEDAHG
ncbi:MAG TPA: helix-turn-helix domain-containing protein [Clostridia bacterium]|nr:helix-turn-helix domain-containing protein [Clostridia bacterium]